MRSGSFGGVVGLVLVTVLSAGCSTGSPAAPAPATLPSDGLPAKMRGAVSKDLAYSVRDATDLGRTVDLQHADLWRVCLTRKGLPAHSVTFGAVPRAEKCPTRWDAHVPAPRTPHSVGDDFQHAYRRLLEKGYDHESIDVRYGSDAGTVDPRDVRRVHGQVCRQYPPPGRAFDASEDVRLYVAVGKCPRA